MTTKKSLLMTVFWTALAGLFATVIVYPTWGAAGTIQFVTVFSLEKLLSMDNLLVMFLIFGYFGIKKEDQSKALWLGLAGAIIFRMLIISSGVYVISHLSWLLYGFAAFLLYSGFGMMFEKDGEYNPAGSKAVTFIKSNFGTLGLFVSCILAVEVSDIIFAIDSIPASFGVTQNPYIILSANLFAVLGLRSLYHAVANGLEVLHGIEKYIGGVLCLVGINVFVTRLLVSVPEMYLMIACAFVLVMGALICKRNNNKKELV